MNDGILTLSGLVILMKNIFCIGSPKYLGNVIDHYFHVLGQIPLGYKPEYIPEDTDGFRYQIISQFTVKAIRTPGAAANKP